MAKTIRQMVIEARRTRLAAGRRPDEEGGLFQHLLSLPAEDERLLNEIDKSPDGQVTIRWLLHLLPNSHQDRLVLVIRRWSDRTGKRKLLDTVDQFERCRRRQESIT